MTTLLQLKRGDRVCTISQYSRPSCLLKNEVGVIIQKIKDNVAWRTKRLNKSMYMVKGPRGETTIFHPEDIKLSAGAIVKAPSLVRKSCEDEAFEKHDDATAGKKNVGISLPILVRTESYDAVQDNDEAESGEDCVFQPQNDEDQYDSDGAMDPWETVYSSKRAAHGEDGSKGVLNRTQSAIDAEIRIAYWRDPVKVRKERKKYERMGKDPPKTAVLSRLENEGNFEVVHFETEDILNGRLRNEDFDILLVPGGYADNYMEALGGYEGEGAEEIKEFVGRGGSYVGICAGAYVGCNFGLELVDVDVVDLEHWNRGMSQRCWLEYSEEGQKIMTGTVDRVNSCLVRYANGPLLSINETSNAIALAIFRSDFAKKKSMKKGIMKDSPAIVVSDSTKARKGRVVLISPHPEDGEPWTKSHFRNLFRWAAGHDPAEVLPEKDLTPENQRKVRGSWWRQLVRLDPRKYKPSLKDYGVMNSLKVLNKEGRDSKTTLLSPNKQRRTVPLKKTATKQVAKDTKHKKGTLNGLLPAPKDGYSMMRTKSIALPYIEYINGPILLTAPHGLKLAGPRRSHKREKHTSEIVMLLAKKIEKYLGQPASFMVWNYKTARKSDRRNLDPNYLLQSEWNDSPFHTTLLKFRAKFKDRKIPCFHVDFHGKGNRRKSSSWKVDIGMEPFVQHPDSVGWNDDEVEVLRAKFQTEFDKNFEGVTLGGKKIISDPDPRLHGWWGSDDDDETTMTHQAVLEGIPSLQLENPRAFRELLMRSSSKGKYDSDGLLDKYARVIVDAYKRAAEIEHSHGIGGVYEEEVPLRVSRPPQDEGPHEEVIQKIGEGDAVNLPFFVYGSLRPDDVTNMPWRDEWLQGAQRSSEGQIYGKMYDDTFASVVLCPNGSTVNGFLIEFPADIYVEKLQVADDIEGYPDFYNRETTTVTLRNGGQAKAWVYTRAKCKKNNPISSGDWVHHKASTNPVLKAVKAFEGSGFPVYQGQILPNGKAVYENNFKGMIDQMVSDARALDGPDPDRQV
jgi:gamma-glutamylcyclotransferase (GGCT)/AIG2-like uncharacterized protein YtfP/glutamine amidotransferase-like uncharacterized protein